MHSCIVQCSYTTCKRKTSSKRCPPLNFSEATGSNNVDSGLDEKNHAPCFFPPFSLLVKDDYNLIDHPHLMEKNEVAGLKGYRVPSRMSCHFRCTVKFSDFLHLQD